MPYTDTMNSEKWVAHAAGDMDDGQELKFKSCIVGPDKAHWLKADVTELNTGSYFLSMKSCIQ